MPMQSTTKKSLSRRWEDYQPSKSMLVWACIAAVIATEEYVQANPWQSVGIAAGVGFLIGLLATRR